MPNGRNTAIENKNKGLPVSDNPLFIEKKYRLASPVAEKPEEHEEQIKEVEIKP